MLIPMETGRYRYGLLANCHSVPGPSRSLTEDTIAMHLQLSSPSPTQLTQINPISQLRDSLNRPEHSLPPCPVYALTFPAPTCGISCSKDPTSRSQTARVCTYSISTDIAHHAVIFKSPATPETYTYADLRATALNFGSNLKAKWSWQKGDVLIVFSPNSIHLPALIWGCHWAEGIVSPANPAYSVDEFKYQIEDSGAKAIAVHSSCLTIAVAAAKLVSFPLDRVLVFGDGDKTSHEGVDHVMSMTRTPAPGMTRKSLDPAQPAFLVYSSGTTGRPKGAMVTHSNVVSSLVLQGQVEGPHLDWRTNRLLAILPMYHIYGMPQPPSPITTTPLT